MPLRLTRPTVGLKPAIPFDDAGQTMDPSVSVPMAAAQRFADTPAPEPELEPQGLRSSAYGFFVRPPRPLHPLVEWLERMLAHSLRLVLPRITAPAARSFSATNESFDGLEPTRASEPAVVIILSAVSMLSLIRTGTPCSGPRGPFALRSSSSCPAMERASGFSSITLLIAGPCLSISSIREVYFSTRERAVNLPDFIPSCRSVIVNSSSSKDLIPEAGTSDSVSRAASRPGGESGANDAAALPTTVALRKVRRLAVGWASFRFRGILR